MLPTTAAVEVESPPKERVAPVSICGQVAVRVSCFALKVSQSVPVRQPFTPLAEEVQSKVPLAPPMNWPNVPEYVIGAVTVGVEVAVEYSTPHAVLLRVPAVERLERLVMFWVVLTLKALPELVKRVVEAFVANVEDAMREKGEVALSQSAVEVALTAVPL